MKKAILSIIIVAILIIVSVFSINWLYRTGDFSSGPEPTTVSELVDCSNEFSFDMYKELAAGDNENVFFSPYSITTALGMAYEGARGDTAAEMASVLNFPTDNQTRLDIMKAYQSELNKNSSTYELATANAYWLLQNANLEEDYRNAIESYYLAHGEELDFIGDPVGSTEIINTWVEEQTNDKILDILPPSSITRNTYLVLTNAIYFLSDWKYQFDVNATENRSFKISGQENIMAETMHMNDESIGLNYSENDDAQMLQLPYKGDELSMYIMLPRENDIASLESKLNYEYLNDMKEDMSPEWVDVYLPKFKFEQKYMLNDYLANMGMPTAFGNQADFSGITSDTSLFISAVIHQAFVDVNEEGTEAAAATVVIMDRYSVGGSDPEPILFNADHPFIFFIQHEETGQILFMGKVGNPNA
ncbi:MAG: serpin family protein [Candidatus Thermoplasmatota archaeon]|nr:serpin family protein [Euryarchaeota archaeon]MBU4031294.1 serpin family protein [Candidatus Thermoplasmatota archaeon]MBU4070787.1 serpin family protein [Candidatus Thermoplasmatota archaeon]MBU4144223.1 serpin family protein [Candidatus Thermoplasmatota archaeon]MBU4590969.1 serpin family protein [Candidatus Thermoplasmatota archaeon]